MKISITDCTVINQFQFDQTNFDIFQSRCIVDGKEHTFMRNVSNLFWINTQIKSEDTLLGYGEDPRAFDLLGMPACYSVRFTEQDRFIPQLYIKVENEWNYIPQKCFDGCRWLYGYSLRGRRQ